MCGLARQCAMMKSVGSSDNVCVHFVNMSMFSFDTRRVSMCIQQVGSRVNVCL